MKYSITNASYYEKRRKKQEKGYFLFLTNKTCYFE